METSFLESKVLWAKSDENMDRFVKKSVKVKKDLQCFYLYTPLSDGVIDLVNQEIDKISGCAIGIVTCENGIDHEFEKVNMVWTLPKELFYLCRGTKYPSWMAERMILNEMLQWNSWKLYSVYPTVSSAFQCLKTVEDWELTQQLIQN